MVTLIQKRISCTTPKVPENLLGTLNKFDQSYTTRSKCTKGNRKYSERKTDRVSGNSFTANDWFRFTNTTSNDNLFAKRHMPENKGIDYLQSHPFHRKSLMNGSVRKISLFRPSESFPKYLNRYRGYNQNILSNERTYRYSDPPLNSTVDLLQNSYGNLTTMVT